MKFKSKKNKTENIEPGRKPQRQQDSRIQSRQVFSYYSNRSQETEPRARKDTFEQEVKQTNRRAKHIPTIIAALVVLFSLIYATLIDTNSPSIVPLTQNSVNILNTTDFYKKSVAEIMNQDLSSKSKITINTKDIEKKIKEKHPELDKVSLNIPLMSRRPIIQISPRQPKLVVLTNSGSYAVDNKGVILASLENVPEPQRAQLLNIKDSVFTDSGPGDIVLPESTIRFIDEVKFQFEQKGIAVDYLELPAVANELHVKPKDKNYIIKFNLQGSAREQSGVYFALLDRLGADPGIAAPQEYVDVRVESRAFIK